MSFVVKKRNESLPEAWDDRQCRIKGWNKEAIRDAMVLVIGAGAIANEVIKNLALLGFGYVFIADMDVIENTNLTRTVLFSKQDLGKQKSVVATERFLEMNLEPTASADSFVGDIVFELGDGIFRRVDLVLGCLDNLETRFAVNKICMRYNIPYIDGAIGSLDCCLKVMNGHQCACLECYAGNALLHDRFRQSCAATMRAQALEGKAATVQTASAIVAGFEVQEALKIICGMNPQYGKEYWFFGSKNSFESFPMALDPNCCAHLLDARANVIETPLSYKNTMRELLLYVQEKGFDTIRVDEDKYRMFVVKTKCPNCGKTVDVGLPFYKFYADDYFCQDCQSNKVFNTKITEEETTGYNCYSLENTTDNILDMPLEQVGIPAFHVLPADNSLTGETAYFELTGDLQSVAPAYAKKHDAESEK